MALVINYDNFEEIKNSDKPVLIDFYADWCGPCRMLAPTVEALSSDERFIVGKINVDDCPDLARKFDVASIPTLVVLKNGEETARSLGVRTKDQIIKMIEE